MFIRKGGASRDRNQKGREDTPADSLDFSRESL